MVSISATWLRFNSVLRNWVLNGYRNMGMLERAGVLVYEDGLITDVFEQLGVFEDAISDHYNVCTAIPGGSCCHWSSDATANKNDAFGILIYCLNDILWNGVFGTTTGIEVKQFHPQQFSGHSGGCCDIRFVVWQW